MKDRTSYSLLTLLILFVCSLHCGCIYMLSDLAIPSYNSLKKSAFLTHIQKEKIEQKAQSLRKQQQIIEALENLSVNQMKVKDEESKVPKDLLVQTDQEIVVKSLASLELSKRELPSEVLSFENPLEFSKDFPHVEELKDSFCDYESSFFEQNDFIGLAEMVVENTPSEKQIPVGSMNVSDQVTLKAQISFENSSHDEIAYLNEPSNCNTNLSFSISDSEAIFLPTSSFEMDHYDFEDFGILPSSNDFDIAVEYIPKAMQPGFIFKAVFTPKKGTVFKRIRQNLFFLVDRSNSISKTRYEYTKQAIASVLEILNPDDTFNIHIFDDKLVRLSSESLKCTKDNILSAKEFLQKQSHGGLFASTDIYASLGKIIPKEVPDTEVNIALLLSDGDSYLSVDQQRQMIGRFTQENKGKVSLFCMASGEANNLALLDLISTFNKGCLVYASSHDQIELKLMQLIRSLQQPVGKSMIATAISETEKTSIHLYPRTIRLPNLYENRAFSIFGSISRLEDFTLFLQGNYYDKKFDIKKKIAFNNARMGTPTLERQWTLFQAHDHLENFFHDGNPSHYEKVKQLLAPLNIPIPFSPKT